MNRRLFPVFPRRALFCAVTTALAALAFTSAASAADAIADRPEKLTFPPLTYEPPDPASFRVALKSGPIA